MDWMLKKFSDPFYVVMTVTIALVVTWFIRWFVTRPKNLPPGPKGLPLLGVAWALVRANPNPLHLFSSWADEYGEIMTFKAGPLRLVVLNSYQAIVDAFQHPALNDRPQSRLTKEVLGYDNSGLILATGNTWKEQRNFIHSVFRSFGVGRKSFEENIAAEVKQLLDALEGIEGAAFDPNDLCQQAVANVICSVVFGTQYKYSDADFRELIRKLKANLELASSGGIFLFLPLPGISKIPFGAPKKIVRNMLEITEFVVAQIRSHERALDAENPRDLIDLYLNKIAETKDSGTSFNEVNLLATVSDLFFAGTETSSTTLLWGILFMMAYPDVQARVQEELNRVVGRERLPRLDDEKNLPYTSAVLLEVQRKGIVAPIGVPHIAAEDTSLHGYTIPKGCTIIPNIWKVMNDRELFEDPDKFNPDRFLTADGQLIKKKELIFFSTGRRVCLGERLARMEMFLFFTGLLHRFTFRKPQDTPSLVLDGILGSTMTPKPFKTCAVKVD